MIWITGLPGSGKTTLAGELHKRLQRSFILDGDVMRQTFWPELGFDWADREKNVVRTGEVARILGGFGIEPIVSTVSPSREARAQVRRNCSEFGFVEIYLDAPWEVLKKRRPTLYSIRYEVPMAPEFQFNTADVSPQDMAERIVSRKPKVTE